MSDQSTVTTEVELDVGQFLRSLLRKLPYILVFVAIVAVGFFLFLSTLEPRYTAETAILIETQETGLTAPAQGGVRESTNEILDQQAVESQVQLVRSREIARSVVERLDLASRAEFDPNRRDDGYVGQAMALLGLSSPLDPALAGERVLEDYYKRLAVFTISGSRVISVTFTTNDPQLSADVANAIAEDYLVLQSRARRDNTAEAAEWLSTQIADLSDRVQEAEARVETFRSENDLFSSVGTTAPATLSQQQLADLNSELTRVRAQRADAEARAAQIAAGLSSGTTPNQTEVLNSPLIQRLVEQQVALRSQIAQLSATLLPQHPRMRELQAQIADLDRQVATEARKILASLEAEAELAAAREQEIDAELARLKTATARANNAEVDLRALEREAAAQRDLLDSYLRRYREALAREQAGLLPANARIISKAAVPLEPSFPRKPTLTGAMAAAALVLALAFALLRELASGRSFRPVGAREAPPLAPDALPVAGDGRRSRTEAGAPDKPRAATNDPTIAPAVVDRVKESLRTIVSRIASKGYRRILVTLVEGSDDNGRPLAAVALARALARADMRTVVIDFTGDDANAVAMGERAGLQGLTDVIAGSATFTQAIFRDRKSRVHFVPTGRDPLDSDAISAESLTSVLSALAMTYDTVVLDVSDAMIGDVAPACDAAVVVSEFDEADVRTVRAFDRVASSGDVPTMLLVVDPAPEEDEEEAEAVA